MTDDDAGLECATIVAWTRVRLSEQGLPFEGEFCVDVLRRDGETLRFNVASIFRVAELVRELNPRRFTLQVGRADDAVQLLDQLEALFNCHATTLH